jgi:hypothetical protein
MKISVECYVEESSKVDRVEEIAEMKEAEQKVQVETRIHEDEIQRRKAFERRLAECDKLEFKCKCKEAEKVVKARVPIKQKPQRPASVHSSSNVYTRQHGDILLNRRKEKKPVVPKPLRPLPSAPVKSYLRPFKSSDESKRLQIVEKPKKPERV